MSLINQMLRDLDERQGVVCAATTVRLPRRRSKAAGPWYAKRRNLAWIGGSLLVALLSVVFLWDGESVAYSEARPVSTLASATDPLSLETNVPLDVAPRSDPGNQVIAAVGRSEGGEVVSDAAVPVPAVSPVTRSVSTRSLRTGRPEEIQPASMAVLAGINGAATNVQDTKDVTPATGSATESSRDRTGVTREMEGDTPVTARTLREEVEPISADIGAAESAKEEKSPSMRAVKRRVDRPARPPDAIYQEARRLLDQGRLAESEANLRRVLEMENDHLEARQLLTLLLIRGSRLTEASALLTEGLNIAPHNSSFTKLKARVRIAQGDLADAIDVLEAMALGETDLEGLAMLAAVYQQHGDHVGAVKTYRELLGYSSQSGVSWAGLAISLDAQGEREAAVQSYQRALGFASLAPKVRAYAHDRITALTNIN